jgi:MFS family permease
MAVPGGRRRILAGVSANVMVLGLVSLLTDASSEMIYPVLPLFLSAIGATGAAIGLIEGAAEATASFLKVISGWYSDTARKRKPFITAGYALSTLAKPTLALANSFAFVLGVRIVERIGKGIRAAPRDALIADSTAQESMGKAYGFHKAMDSTGAVIGPLLVLPILLTAAVVTTDTYRLIFLLATIPAALAVIVIVLFVREIPAKARMTAGPGFVQGLRRLDRGYWMLLLVVAVFFFGEISYAFFILQAKNAGLDDISVILVYVLYNIVFVLTAIPAGALSDRIGRAPVIAISFVLFAFTCAFMSMMAVIALAIGFVLYGLYKGCSEGVFKAFVVDKVPQELRGTALGAYYTVSGLVLLPGGVAAGVLWDSWGPAATFGLGALTSAVALIALLLMPRSK